ncbi:hypothetical protein BKK52_00790 [Rodentibacter trehalosifermentans]|uniref:DUF4145 domain-containing protein n=1 Tax=Rodentibacter trehalosifermentans TaxID=1908263 RepID=A0A1V3J674_9PAST|nr:DUF4145 domain-containing protein [Rodentibacter trehalosifermentans]OOF50717.1 hypothetical protein BKK52_00790 [Rodentibacter trehalosifermentans]
MITFGYDCPYCAKRDVAFTVKHITSHIKEKARYQGVSFHTVFATCNHCLNGISALHYVADSDVYVNGAPLANGLISAVTDTVPHFFDEIFGRELDWFPKAPKPDIPQYLPVNVERKFAAGEKIYFQTKHDESLVEFAGTAYRSALELALKHLDDNTDKNLNWRINHLVKTQVLVKSMGDFAHSIRSLGNDATHNEISLVELEQLRLFTQLFLQYTFTLPAMIPAVEKQG